MTAFNHVGLCVTDLARSRRFYEELFGFVLRNELTVPDGPTAKLLRITPPVGLSAVYLERDGFVLELLHFARPGNAPQRDRAFTEPGLTHLSVSVDDIVATCARVTELGGEVLADTDLGGLGQRQKLEATNPGDVALPKPAERAQTTPETGDQRLGSLMARSAMMFFCTSVAPAPIEVKRCHG